MTAKTITVTLNPSLDRTIFIHHLALGYQNHTSKPTRLDPAGRGMNISRALHRLNFPTHAILLVGDDATGRAYRSLIAEEGFPIAIEQRKGRTRSNIIIVDSGEGTETHLIEESAGVPQEGFEFVVESLHRIIAPDDIVIYAGGLPAEAYMTTYAWLTDIAHEAGAKVALVTYGEPLDKALDAHPDLVMMRQVELEAFVNHPVRVYEDILGASEKLCARGAGMVLTITGEMGGVALVSEDAGRLVELPELEASASGTSSGVADAMLAGFLAGYMREHPMDETLMLASGAAMYTASRPGCEFGPLDEVEAIAAHEAIQVSRPPYEQTTHTD